MRIIEWNCQGAFRLKNEKILSFKPDILIIPECENEDKLKFGKLTPKPNEFIWFGDSTNKGIGIFSYSDYSFEFLKSFNPEFKHVIPLKATRLGESFFLFAIWAMNNKENPDARYIEQVWLAINYYKELLNGDTILIGDFNSNQIWDYKERVGNHSDVVGFLKERNIYSLYHLQNSVNHGEEKDSTFFMYRKKDRPYHVDYCFVSKQILNNGYNLILGPVDEWIDLSDHLPMVIEILNK
jgi:exodeoxyribonuclease III